MFLSSEPELYLYMRYLVLLLNIQVSTNLMYYVSKFGLGLFFSSSSAKLNKWPLKVDTHVLKGYTKRFFFY